MIKMAILERKEIVINDKKIYTYSIFEDLYKKSNEETKREIEEMVNQEDEEQIVYLLSIFLKSALKIAISEGKSKEDINKIVDKRVDEMVKEGLLEEIESLLKQGITFSNQSMQGIGYKEFKDYFNNVKTKEECINDVKTHTHQFIKRQYTWFNNQMNVEWYDNKEDALNSIINWYE